MTLPHGPASQPVRCALRNRGPHQRAPQRWRASPVRAGHAAQDRLHPGRASGLAGIVDIRAALATLPDGRTPTKADWSRLARDWGHGLMPRSPHCNGLRLKLDSCIGCGCLSMKACALYNPKDAAAVRGRERGIFSAIHGRLLSLTASKLVKPATSATQMTEQTMASTPPVFRPLVPADRQTLALAAHRALGSATSGLRPIELLQAPGVRVYAENWGRAGDLGVVAQVDGVDVGACWMRCCPPSIGFAFVDEVDATIGHRARARNAAPRLRSSADAGGVAAARAADTGRCHYRASAEPGAVPVRILRVPQVELRSGYHLMVGRVATINALSIAGMHGEALGTQVQRNKSAISRISTARSAPTFGCVLLAMVPAPRTASLKSSPVRCSITGMAARHCDTSTWQAALAA